MKQQKLVDILSKGMTIRFTSGKNPATPDFDNTYSVIETGITNQIDEMKNHTKVCYVSSLNADMVGRETIIDFNSYIQHPDGFFRSNREYRNKKGELTWVSTGCIEILE